jgi:hypothetical protein
MSFDRYWFLGFPVPLATAQRMADRLTFRDTQAPLGAQHVVRSRTQYYVAVRRVTA